MAHHGAAKPQSGTGKYHAKPLHSGDWDVSREYQLHVAELVMLVIFSTKFPSFIICVC